MANHIQEPATVHTTLLRLANGHFHLTIVLVTGLYAVIIAAAVITTLNGIATRL